MPAAPPPITIIFMLIPPYSGFIDKTFSQPLRQSYGLTPPLTQGRLIGAFYFLTFFMINAMITITSIILSAMTPHETDGPTMHVHY